MHIDQYGTRVILNGVCVKQSKNLRGLRDYARVSRVVSVQTEKDPANNARGILRVTYANGATCAASFASHSILIDFVRRRVAWRNASISHLSGEMGYLTRPGIIAGGVK